MLSVPPGFDPIGESMVSLVTRIQVSNRLSITEIGKSFSSTNVLNSHNGTRCLKESYFGFEKIQTETGWTKEQLQSSFPSFYNRFSSNLNDVKRPDGVIKIAENLRTCPECFKSGYHLMLHQFVDWVRCPIHKHDLVTTCPCCESEFGYYKVDKDWRRALSCQRCGFGPFTSKLTANDGIIKNKKSIVTEFSNWCLSIQEEIDSYRVKRGTFLTPAKSHSDIVLYYKLFGGPDWFKECLLDGDGNNIFVRSRRIDSRPQSRQKLNLVYPFTSGGSDNDARIKASAKLAKIHKQLKSTLLTEFMIFSTTMNEEYQADIFGNLIKIGVSYNYLDEFKDYLDGHSAALELIQEEVLKYIADPQQPFYSCHFWNLWQLGPGRGLKIGLIDKNRVVVRDLEWAMESTRHWFWSMLFNMYQMVLIRSIISHDEKDRYIVTSGELSKLIEETRCSQIYYGNDHSFEEVTRMLPNPPCGFGMMIDDLDSTGYPYSSEMEVVDKLVTFSTIAPYAIHDLHRGKKQIKRAVPVPEFRETHEHAWAPYPSGLFSVTPIEYL